MILSTTKKHLTINIAGIKLKIKKPLKNSQLKSFLVHEVPPNTVLLIEMNDCHQETLFGYYKYLKDAGFNVEVLTNILAENVFENSNENISSWGLSEKEFVILFKKFDFKKYERIMFNSKILYGRNRKNTDICAIFPTLPAGKKETIFVQHHIDKIENDKNHKYIILANPAKTPLLEHFVVNPHYYGNITITPKNDLTTFISVGDLLPERRNSQLLIQAITKLIENKITNFKVTIIGAGKIGNLPEELKPFINIKGRLSFTLMYKELEQADFFLPLLDPEINFHKRYMKNATSGSFQLIYGFLKPCIIHKTFADIYGFDSTNSIVYEDNSALSIKMQQAVDMQKTVYGELQHSLKIKAAKIEQQSIYNLKNILD